MVINSHNSGGGALLCQDGKDYEFAKKLSTQAKEETLWYEHKEIGYNYRLSNVLASIGVAQMELLDKRVTKKREIFNHYFNILSEVDEVEFMPEIDKSFGSRWLTTITFDKNNPMYILRVLKKENIESRPLWKPMHLQPIFKDCKFYGGDVSQKLFQKGLCLPSGTALKLEQIERIGDIIKKSLR